VTDDSPAGRVRQSQAPDLVVLLHGMGRTWRSMSPIARACERAGFTTLNVGYPGTRKRLAAIVDIVRARMAAANGGPEAAGRPEQETGPRLHFVGHSLGCIVIRSIVAQHRPGRLGRIVLMTPPNRGARLADLALPWLGWLLRPLPDLTVGGAVAASIPTPAGLEIGVIAGTRDRTVSLEETRLPGETDRALVPYGHSFLMRRRDVQEMTVRFLRTGRFTPR
jgi:alpha-beta hydrolase superfamily lysophospholipase